MRANKRIKLISKHKSKQKKKSKKEMNKETDRKLAGVVARERAARVDGAVHGGEARRRVD